MPPLVNIQHEIFAQEVAKGRKLGEAYALAAALEQIGIELGMFVRRTANWHKHDRKEKDFTSMSPEERAAEIARLTRLARQVIGRARTIEDEAVEVIEPTPADFPTIQDGPPSTP